MLDLNLKEITYAYSLHINEQPEQAQCCRNMFA